jgi:hypothetical protein
MVARDGRPFSDRFYFLAGSVLGGTLTGSLAGVASLAFPTLDFGMIIVVIGLTIVAALARDMGVFNVHLPENRRQVRSSVYDLPASAGALMFGFELGTGFRTFITSSAPYIALVGIVLVGRPATAILAGVGFGTGRGFIPFLLPTLRNLADLERRPGYIAGVALPRLSVLATGVSVIVLRYYS